MAQFILVDALACSEYLRVVVVLPSHPASLGERDRRRSQSLSTTSALTNLRYGRHAPVEDASQAGSPSPTTSIFSEVHISEQGVPPLMPLSPGGCSWCSPMLLGTFVRVWSNFFFLTNHITKVLQHGLQILEAGYTQLSGF